MSNQWQKTIEELHKEIASFKEIEREIFRDVDVRRKFIFLFRAVEALLPHLPNEVDPNFGANKFSEHLRLSCAVKLALENLKKALPLLENEKMNLGEDS